MQTRLIQTSKGEILIRPTHIDDAVAYRALRLEGLQAHPEAFGADYPTSAARPIEYWQERMQSGAGGEQGVTYVPMRPAGRFGIPRWGANNFPKTQPPGPTFGGN